MGKYSSYFDASNADQITPDIPEASKPGKYAHYFGDGQRDTIPRVINEVEQQPAGFTGTVKSTSANILNSIAGQPVEDIGALTGIKSLQNAGRGVREYAEGVQANNPSQIGSLSDVVAHPWEATKEALGNVIPQIPLSLAGAAAGAKLGAQAAASLPLPPALKAAAPVVGGLAGVFAPSYAQEYQQIRQKQHETGNEDMGKAALTAIPTAGLETVADATVLGRFLPDAVRNSALGKGAGYVADKLGAGDLVEGGVKNRLIHAGKQALAGAGVEGGTEYGQTYLEQVGGGQNTNTPEALNERQVAAALGAIGGGVLQGGSRAFDKPVGPLERAAQQAQQAPQGDTYADDVNTQGAAANGSSNEVRPGAFAGGIKDLRNNSDIASQRQTEPGLNNEQERTVNPADITQPGQESSNRPILDAAIQQGGINDKVQDDTVINESMYGPGANSRATSVRDNGGSELQGVTNESLSGQPREALPETRPPLADNLAPYSPESLAQLKEGELNALRDNVRNVPIKERKAYINALDSEIQRRATTQQDNQNAINQQEASANNGSSRARSEIRQEGRNPAEGSGGLFRGGSEEETQVNQPQPPQESRYNGESTINANERPNEEARQGIEKGLLRPSDFDHLSSDGVPMRKEDDGSFTDIEGNNFADDGYIKPASHAQLLPIISRINAERQASEQQNRGTGSEIGRNADIVGRYADGTNRDAAQPNAISGNGGITGGRTEVDASGVLPGQDAKREADISSADRSGAELAQELSNESTQRNNKAVTPQPEAQDTNSNPPQSVIPATPENLAGTLAEPVVPKAKWVTDQLKAQGITAKHPDFNAKRQELRKQYEKQLVQQGPKIEQAITPKNEAPQEESGAQPAILAKTKPQSKLNEKILSAPSKVPGYEHKTKSEAIQSLVDQERTFHIVYNDDYKARAKDEAQVKEIEDAVIELAKRNWLGQRLQSKYEELAKLADDGTLAKLKERIAKNDYKKPEYRVYQGIDRKGGFNTISKQEYEYSQQLLNAQKQVHEQLQKDYGVSQPIAQKPAETPEVKQDQDVAVAKQPAQKTPESIHVEGDVYKNGDNLDKSKPGEVAPIAEAFDNLFSEIKTKPTDKGTALYSGNDLGNKNETSDEAQRRDTGSDKFPQSDNEQTNALRREAIASFTGRTEGLAIVDHLERTGASTLVGLDARSPDELAAIAQVYRNPRFETSRIVFTRGGKVVFETGVTSRLPGISATIPNTFGTDIEFYKWLREQKVKTEADGYWLMHNHPSGDPTPSIEDEESTKAIAMRVPGFLGHVIINSNKYAVIKNGSAKEVITRYFGEDMLLKASKPHHALNQVLASYGDLAELGKSLQKDGYVTLIGLASSKVRMVYSLPVSEYLNERTAKLVTRYVANKSGSSEVYVIGDGISDAPHNAYLKERNFVAGVFDTKGNDAVKGINREYGIQYGVNANDVAKLTTRDSSESNVNQKPVFKSGNSLEDKQDNADIRYSKAFNPNINILNELAKEDSVFRHPVSDKKTLKDIMAEVMPSAKFVHNNYKAGLNVEMYRTEKGNNFWVFEQGNKVWIDVSNLRPGEYGNKIYAAVGNYAYNTGKVFTGDPNGLSEAAVVRRTNLMLSLALRFGSTDFLGSSPEQAKGNPDKGIAPLRWEGDYQDKVNAMINQIVSTLHNQLPILKGYRYDFDNQQFEDKLGRPLPANWATRLAQSDSGRMARTGEATLRKAVVLQSIASSTGREKSELLERIKSGGMDYTRNGVGGIFSKTDARNSGSTVAEITAALPRKVKGLLDAGKLEVIQDSDKGACVEAYYEQSKDRIVLIASNITPDSLNSTLSHELIHRAASQDPKVKAALDRFEKITQRSYDLAAAGKGSATEKAAYQRVIAAETPESDRLHEYQAYLISHHERNHESLSGIIRKAVSDFIATIRSALVRSGLDFGFVKSLTPSDLTALSRYGASVQPNASENPNSSDNADIRYSKAADSLNAIGSAIKSSKGIFKEVENQLEHTKAWPAIKANVLAFLTPRMLAQTSKKLMPMLDNELIPNRDAMAEKTVSLQNEYANKVMLPFEDLIRKQPEQAKQVSNLLLESRINGVDASADKFAVLADVDEILAKIKTIKQQMRGRSGESQSQRMAEARELELQVAHEANRKRAYPELRDMYNKLSPDAQNIYKLVVAHGEKTIDEWVGAAEQKVRDLTTSRRTKAAMLAELKKMRESLRVQGPYVPLSRFGKYWVSSQDAKGEWSFDMFETPGEQKDFMAQRQKEGAKFYHGTNLQKDLRKQGVNMDFIAKVDEMISELGEGPQVEDLRDSLYQLYLQSLPDLSSRKHFIHAKKTPGFSTEVYRAVSSKAHHDANQIGRMLFGHKLRQTLNDAAQAVEVASLKGKRDQLDYDLQMLEFFHEHDLRNQDDAGTRNILVQKTGLSYEDVRKEAKLFAKWRTMFFTDKDVEREIKRVKNIRESADKIAAAKNGAEFSNNVIDELNAAYEEWMSPSVNPLAIAANQFGFAVHLAASPAAGIVNALQTPIYVAPVLAARFGIRKTNAELTKAYKQFFEGSKDKLLNKEAPTIADKLSPEEKRALDKHAAQIDRTLAFEVSEAGEANVKYAPLRRKITQAMGLFFHHTERLNREVSFIAAYRLARKDDMNADDAGKYASDILADTHFDYGSTNRARFMRGNFMRVVTQFKQYSLGTTWLLGRLIHQSFQGESQKVKIEARKAFAGIMGMQIVFAGALGLPIGGISLMMGAMASLFGDDDDPWNWEADAQQWLADHLGEEAGRAVARGFVPEALRQVGIPAPDLSSRLSMADLWIRDPQREMEGKDAGYYWLTQLLGPSASSFVNMFGIMKLLSEGHTDRALEQAMPKAITDILQSGRYGTEGVRNLRGDDIVDDVTMGESLLKAFGFTPERITEAYIKNNSNVNKDKFLAARRSHYMDIYAEAKRDNDSDEMLDVRQQINAWNHKHPAYKITTSDITQSIKSRNRITKNNMQSGAYLSKRFQKEGGYDF